MPTSTLAGQMVIEAPNGKTIEINGSDFNREEGAGLLTLYTCHRDGLEVRLSYDDETGQFGEPVVIAGESDWRLRHFDLHLPPIG